MSDRYDDLRAAAEAAPNGNLDTAERVTVGEIQCPLCGDGVVDHKTWTNIDDKPVGIEVFGIGEALTNYETFVRLANPETIKALLSERDSLLAALKVADDALCEYACRSPDEPFLACMRSDDQCNQDCGRAAFDALCAVRAAALTTKEG